MTETAQYADVILPGMSYAEKEGTFSNTERRVQRVRKAVDLTKDPDLHDAHQKIGKKTYSTAASIGGSWAGGALGAKGGALAGAAIGTAILPGLGTAVGGIAGGLLLGVAGSSLRKWVIDITDVGE